MPRLRKVSRRDPGWTRRRAEKRFVYLDGSGADVLCTTFRSHLQLAGMPYPRALRTAFSVLTLGSSGWAARRTGRSDNSHYLATFEKEHVTIESGAVIFDAR